ncbi:MAG: DUF945 family protein [Pseudomonadota bacterium]
MKKIVVVVVVLVLLLVVAPWGVGRVAQQRIDNGLAKLTEQAPYLKVVENKYTTGWFKSEQVITFEAFGPWMKAMSDAMKKAGAPMSTDMEPHEPGAVEPPADAAAAATDPAVDPAAVPPVEPAALPESPMRFTVRNEILHGPVLGLSGLGIARVESHLVLAEDTRKKIAELFGPKDPLEITTRVGFFGGGTTTFKSEGRTIKPKDSKVQITWETFKLAVGYSHNADSYDMDGKWPKVEVNNLDDKSHVVMSDMTIGGEGRRVRGDLYDGNFTFGIDNLVIDGKDSESFEMKGLNVTEVIETKGDFTGVSAKMGTGEVKVKELTSMGIALKEVHYDIGVRRLHTPTLEKIFASMKAMYAKPLPVGVEVEKMVFAPFKEGGAELLKYDPEFVIDRIGIVTADGDGYIKGLVTLKGATPDDFGSGSMGLIGKIHADITIDVSEKMIQKFPNGSTAAGAGVDSGYVKREGDRLICKILFAEGKLTVNGKPQAIPGLGGPPQEGPPPQ